MPHISRAPWVTGIIFSLVTFSFLRHVVGPNSEWATGAFITNGIRGNYSSYSTMRIITPWTEVPGALAPPLNHDQSSLSFHCLPNNHNHKSATQQHASLRAAVAPIQGLMVTVATKITQLNKEHCSPRWWPQSSSGSTSRPLSPSSCEVILTVLTDWKRTLWKREIL